MLDLCFPRHFHFTIQNHCCFDSYCMWQWEDLRQNCAIKTCNKYYVALFLVYRDMYPVLVKALHAAHNPCAPSESLLLLELQRVKSLLVLLTQVTLTAGCHQELQSELLRYDTHKQHLKYFEAFSDNSFCVTALRGLSVSPHPQWCGVMCLGCSPL